MINIYFYNKYFDIPSKLGEFISVKQDGKPPNLDEGLYIS